MDEHFVPKHSLNLDMYIKKGDLSGVHHLIRYFWAIKIILNFNSLRNILDIACGVGYGSYLIAKEKPEVYVIGVDYDYRAIKHAQKHYSLPNLDYKLGDVTRWEETIGKNLFDCIISFDTIEHISHREIMMQNFVEHLHINGCFLFSTPCGHGTTILKPEWENHKIEYSATSLYDFLKRYFKTVLRPDDSSLPHIDVFDCLNGTNVSYLLKMNPVLCKEPIVIPKLYKGI